MAIKSMENQSCNHQNIITDINDLLMSKISLYPDQIKQTNDGDFSINDSKILTKLLLKRLGVTLCSETNEDNKPNKQVKLDDFRYSQRLIKKISDSSKSSMFFKDDKFTEYKSVYDISNDYGKSETPILQKFFSPRLFIIKQYSKNNIFWLNKIDENYEDDPIINKYHPLGLDFISCKDRFFVVISNQDNLRLFVLHKGEKLNSTQLQILDKWHDIFQSEANIQPEAHKKDIHNTIWNSLNLDSVNNAFYKDIIQLFMELRDYLIDGAMFSNNNDAVIFTNRLLGRLLFCYFLIKKGVITADYLNIEQENIGQNSDDNYYYNKLSLLFFEVLNTPKNERQHSDIDTPYLNGGLFEKKELDKIKVGFPSGYFKRLFAVFAKYNWTVDESLSNFEVVAIDPEMLGRIFESLLAELKERKTKGAYYTPRVIVDYMCKESLHQYLLTNSDSNAHSIINKIFDNQTSYLIDQKKNIQADIKPHKDHLLKVLDKITVFDPACGSGAFPMGMLQMMLQIYEHLGDKLSVSERKMKIIENSIFGADIEPNAIEIARLRAWLSIIVDEDNNDIKPLPNLDFKFVCCNSLIKLERKGQSSLTDNIALADKLQELQHKYFNANSYKRKLSLRKQYHDLISQSKAQDSLFGKSQYLEQLESYDPFNTGHICQFYDSEFMFGVKDGFDIVIGNPPYVQIQKFSGHTYQEQLKEQKYETFIKSADLYVLFIEKACNLLKQSGVMSFITSNKWMRANYGKLLRQFLSNKVQTLQLIDFGGCKIFANATVDANILTIKNIAPNADEPINACEILMADYNSNINLAQYTQQHRRSLQAVNADSWIIGNNIDMVIKNKIESKGIKLKDWDIKINYGIKTGLNEAFIIDNATKERLCEADPKSAEIIKPILRGRDIKRYEAKWAGLWLIVAKYGAHQYLQSQYKVIYEYLLQFQDKLARRGQCRYGGKNNQGMHHWLELDNCPNDKYLAEFEKEKIVYREIVQNSSFNLDVDQYYPEATTFLITAGINTNLKYLIALLNSDCISWIFKSFYAGGGLGGKGYRYKKIFIEQLPIPQLTPQQQQPFIELVDKIIQAKQQGQDSHKYEKEIDQLVYQLYDLTTEEIAHIESSMK
jgi:hypothetical protein